jgi:phosphatidylglycerol:prolipoprotein diacylglycerol transferase
LNMYGGVLVAILGAFIYCRWKKISTLEMFDYFAPALGLGLGIARIGCFLNGCCFGTPTDLPWGISFPPGSIPYSVYFDAHLHPSQLYISLYGFGLFILLHFMMKRKKFVGQIVAVMFMVEAVFRFAIEYVRYYEEEMVFHLDGIQPTYNQVISLGLFLLGLVIYIYQRKKRQASVTN